jgi:hypothetical protein
VRKIVDMPGHGEVAHYVNGAPNTTMMTVSDSSAHFTYDCGVCGLPVAGSVIARTAGVMWLRCSHCHSGSVMNGTEISPAVLRGESLESLPSDVESAYMEARRALSAGAPTGSELMCRKILMHVAVDKGANPGESFAAYLDYLSAQGYVTPPMKQWVDLIRQQANIATHEIPASDATRAMGTLAFTAQLLRLIYEMDYKVRQYFPSP